MSADGNTIARRTILAAAAARLALGPADPGNTTVLTRNRGVCRTDVSGLRGCGSSGSPATGSSSGGTGGSTYVAGQYLPASKYAAKCAAPRSGTDSVTNAHYPDVQGTATDENNYLRSWTHQLYLWFDQVPDLDPSQYATANYFPLLKTAAKTASGADEDKFHFTYATSTWSPCRCRVSRQVTESTLICNRRRRHEVLWWHTSNPA